MIRPDVIMVFRSRLEENSATGDDFVEFPWSEVGAAHLFLTL